MTASRSVVQGSSSSAARRVIVAAAPTIIREAVAGLASARAAYVTGQTLMVDGGYAV